MRWTVSSLLLFCLTEAALFRLPWYYRYLEPDSSTGRVENYLAWLQDFHPAGVREVLVLGDSRVAEGFSAASASALASGRRLHFWNVGLHQTGPRVWYYFLRDADPSHHRFRNIVIAMDHYSDEDSFDSAPDRLIDTNLALGRLRLLDAWDFAASMKSPENRRIALTECLFKGTLLRRDFQAFLANVPQRLTNASLYRAHGREFVEGYEGNPHSLQGLSLDRRARALSFPPGTLPNVAESIRYTVLPDHPPETGELTRYRMRWFGRILGLYRGTGAHFLFVQLPRAPLPPATYPAPKSFIEWARRQPNVTVAGPDTFQDLETPEDFADGLHLNAKGRLIFTARLSDLVQAWM